MKLKKWAAGLVAVCMAASLMACGDKAAESAAESIVESAADEAAEEIGSIAESASAEAEAVVGKLVMATNAEFDPWEYHDGDEIVGIDADIARAICEKLGTELVIEDMAFDAVIPSIAAGKGDFGMAGMSVTEERKASVDFTETYASSALVLLVKTDNTEITGADETLTGHSVGVQTGTTGDLKATDLVGDDKVERFNSYFEAVQSLKQGMLDAVLIDTAPAKVFLAQNDDLMQVGEELDKEEYAIAVQKGNDDLLNKLNTAIAELKEDGTIDEIMNKYIPAE